MASKVTVDNPVIQRGPGNGRSKLPRSGHADYDDNTKALVVSQEILRLVEASREGRLTERGKRTSLTAFTAILWKA